MRAVLLSAGLVAATMAFLPSAPASATVTPATKTVSLSATFETSGQSLWGVGAATPPAVQGVELFDEPWNGSASGGAIESVSVDTDVPYPCPEWDDPFAWCSYTISVDIGDFGATGSVSSSGRVGMSLDLDGMSGGLVGVKYPVEVDFTMPADKTFGAGDTIEVSTTEAAVQPGAEITTTEPDISGVSLNGRFGFHAGYSASVCIFSCFSVGSALLDIAEVSGEIFSVSRDQIRNPIKASPPDTYCFGAAENLIFGLSSVAAGTRCAGNGGYLARPNVVVSSTTNADGTVSASGADKFAVIPVSAVKWLQRISGVSVFPPVNMNLHDLGGTGISLGWTAMNMVFNTEVVRAETLKFTPKVDVTMAFPRVLSYSVLTQDNVQVASGSGTSVTLRSGNKIRIDVPTDQTVPFQVTPTLSLAVHKLSNHVTNTVTGTGNLSILSAKLSTPSAEYAGVTVWPSTDINVGPAYTESFGLGSTAIQVLSPTEWSLGGFNAPVLAPLSLVPAPPPVVTPVGITPVEGAPFSSTVATFTDEVTNAVPADYVATIDWGDGTALSPGTITGSGGSYSIAGSHTYEQYGPYPIEVDLRTVPAGQLATNHVVTATSATVSDAVLTGTGLTNNTTATGQPILTWPNPSPAAPMNRVATFTDANPFGLLSDLSATIDWGDGTAATTGLVTGSTGGPFTVAGAHDYTELGLHTTTVTLTSLGGSTATATTTTLSYTNPAGGGTFVLGNKKATGAVNFWGSKWVKNNALTVTSTSSFKGWANRTPPVCGSTWSGTSASGNSSLPPTTVPTYMAVAVTSKVSVSGTTTTGNTVAVVVVRTDAGYAPDPSRFGNGTVITVLCGRVG